MWWNLSKKKDDKEIEGWLSNVINDRINVFLDIKNKINLDNELNRLNKNLGDKEKYILNLKKKIENKDYQKRVKEDVQKEDKEKLEKAETEIKKIKKSIENIYKLKKINHRFYFYIIYIKILFILKLLY